MAAGKEPVRAFRVLPLPLSRVRELYARRLTADFPPDELKPLSAIEEALARDSYFCCGAMDGEEILAYAFFVKNGTNALVDYFAVRSDLRDRGVGSRFLGQLIAGDTLKAYGCVLLETDDPDAAPDGAEREIRERRLRFYLRCGLTETGVRAEVWHVIYRILALPVGKAPTAEETGERYTALYRSILPEKVFREKFRIL